MAEGLVRAGTARQCLNRADTVRPSPPQYWQVAFCREESQISLPITAQVSQLVGL